VRGVARITGKASLVAEHGTTFELRPHSSGDGEAGQLIIANDKGYFEGPSRDGASLSRFVNEGRIVKQSGTDSSVIAAAYQKVGNGKVLVKSGGLVMPDDTWARAKVARGLIYGAGNCDGETRACNTDTTEDEQQFATLQIPEGDSNGAKVVVTPVDEEVEQQGVDAIGTPIKAHARNLLATREDPAVIELRYDSTLLDEAGRPSDPLLLRVWHLGPDDVDYAQVLDCGTGGLIPDGEVACVDRRDTSSRVVDRNDVIMVVRAIETSRWIVD
jgi:hypothetical protein